MQNNKTPCQYVIVRFAPFTETGEFANIGVILFAPKLGYFDYKLENRKYGRITNFFNEIEAADYKNIVKNFTLELKRIRQMMEGDATDYELNQAMFRDTVKNREGMIQFSEPRILLAENPENQIQKLFNYYVQRSFVNLEYRETVLETKIKKWFKNVTMPRHLKRETIGDDLYHVSFPFVAMDNGKPLKIIKPFFLGQKEPSRIIDHSLVWKGKLERLHKQLPEKILFTVEGAKADHGGKLQDAYEEAVDTLNKIDMVTVEQGVNKQAIIDFAKSA